MAEKQTIEVKIDGQTVILDKTIEDEVLRRRSNPEVIRYKESGGFNKFITNHKSKVEQNIIGKDDNVSTFDKVSTFMETHQQAHNELLSREKQVKDRLLKMAQRMGSDVLLDERDKKPLDDKMKDSFKSSFNEIDIEHDLNLSDIELIASALEELI